MPGDGAARSAAPPNQPAQKRRCDLRDRGERQQPDRGERRAVRQLRVEKAEHQNAEDRHATHEQHPRADFPRRRRVGLAGAAMQQDRHDEIVGDGDRQRDAVDHHHAGRRREPAEHRRQREAARARGERQRENGQIAVDRAVGESGEPGDRQRRDEQIDQHEIGGKQPGRGDDVARIAILDDADVELARQQQDRRAPTAASWSASWRDRAARRITAAMRGLVAPACASSPRPPKSPQTTKAPTARKATSLTTDSTAMARISPSCCSVGSIRRVPNAMAKAASTNVDGEIEAPKTARRASAVRIRTNRRPSASSG